MRRYPALLSENSTTVAIGAGEPRELLRTDHVPTIQEAASGGVDAFAYFGSIPSSLMSFVQRARSALMYAANSSGPNALI